jgi:hypothetical protein
VLLRRGLAALSLGAGGLSVVALSWWSIVVVAPAVLLAFAVDPD